MVDDEIDYLLFLEKFVENVQKFKGDVESEITKTDVRLVKEFENLDENCEPLNEFIHKSKAVENPLKMEKYASDVIVDMKNLYELEEKRRELLIKQLHSLDYLDKEIQRKKIILTKSFSNKEEEKVGGD